MGVQLEYVQRDLERIGVQLDSLLRTVEGRCDRDTHRIIERSLLAAKWGISSAVEATKIALEKEGG